MTIDKLDAKKESYAWFDDAVCSVKDDKLEDARTNALVSIAASLVKIIELMEKEKSCN